MICFVRKSKKPRDERLKAFQRRNAMIILMRNFAILYVTLRKTTPAFGAAWKLLPPYNLLPTTSYPSHRVYEHKNLRYKWTDFGRNSSKSRPLIFKRRQSQQHTHLRYKNFVPSPNFRACPAELFLLACGRPSGLATNVPKLLPLIFTPIQNRPLLLELHQFYQVISQWRKFQLEV